MIQTNDLPVVPLPDTPETSHQLWESLKGLSLDDAMTKIANSMVDFAFKLLIAILVFYIGRFIIRRIFKVVRNVMVNRRIDASLTTFVLSFVKMVLYFILIITIVGILGIETSSFLALFASAGVAIGMALSGTLQNFAGGVLILLLKPYKVGDFIEAGGFTGTVKEIQIFHTVLNTVDNKAIIIPNGGLSTGSINNYSLESYRRVDWTVGLSYGFDYDAASKLIMEMLLSDDRVVKGTIEADKEMRRQRSLAAGEVPFGEEAQADDTTPDPDKKESWWKRFRARQRHRQEVIQEKIREKISMNAGLPLNVERPPFVGLNQLADSSVNLTVRAWTRADFYWGLYFDMNARFYKELPQKGFDFPFPQLDVHIQQ
ncbi:MAG: mechanosensitive ion channel [Muribaculaceae bacterium]|nr:mechanosensitive ion channel [Muribaculaceae bacterium]